MGDKPNILLVEDDFLIAYDMKLQLEEAGTMIQEFERAERERQKFLAEREAECTFHPKTNLMSNRDLIRQIMNDD